MSRVFFTPAGRLDQAIPRLIEATTFPAMLDPGQALGVKVHFGEDGNRNHIRPAYVRTAVDLLAPHVSDCALVETCTLYRGSRARAEDHIRLAHRHGFTPEATGCRIVITDGKLGEDYVKVPVNLTHVKEARLGAGLAPFRQLLNMAHFKGHMVTGFGGVLKNLGMGLAAKGGKLEMHSQSKPYVVASRCTACNDCVEYCPHGAIELRNDAAIIGGDCVGCASCIPVCPDGAIKFKWSEVSENVGAKVVEYAAAAVKGRTVLHMNFVQKVTPNCDCMDKTEKPLMPDVGAFASLDPVACEQAAYDRCRQALHKAWPELTPRKHLEYAEQIGLGTRKYELEEVR